MILFKEPQMVKEQSDGNKNNGQDFQFYTVVNNLSAVERLPKGFWKKLVGGIKSFFRGKERPLK